MSSASCPRATFGVAGPAYCWSVCITLGRVGHHRSAARGVYERLGRAGGDQQLNQATTFVCTAHGPTTLGVEVFDPAGALVGSVTGIALVPGQSATIATQALANTTRYTNLSIGSSFQGSARRSVGFASTSSTRMGVATRSVCRPRRQLPHGRRMAAWRHSSSTRTRTVLPRRRDAGLGLGGRSLHQQPRGLLRALRWHREEGRAGRGVQCQRRARAAELSGASGELPVTPPRWLSPRRLRHGGIVRAPRSRSSIARATSARQVFREARERTVGHRQGRIAPAG